MSRDLGVRSVVERNEANGSVVSYAYEAGGQARSFRV